MAATRLWIPVMLAAALLAGCESAPVKKVEGLFQNKGEQELSAGVTKYEDGDYKGSAKDLQTALDEGLAKPDQVKAHKYLAFIHCVSGRERQCRDEFRKALEIDPGFELKPAEAGHPIWGPVFRNVKARK